MQAPPSYQLPPTSAPNRSVNRTLWIVAGVILLSCCIILGVFGYFAFRMMKEAMPWVGCFVHMSDIDKAMREYAKTHDGKLPPADKWQDELLPYFKDQTHELPFTMRYDLKGEAGCKDEDGKTITGIAYNVDVAGKVFDKLQDPADTAILFEIDRVGRNLHGKYEPVDPDKSPMLVMGERRGWLELAASGDLYMLVKEGGRIKRELLERTDSTRIIRKRDKETNDEP
jgi:hypothetical protein